VMTDMYLYRVSIKKSFWSGFKFLILSFSFTFFTVYEPNTAVREMLRDVFNYLFTFKV
jgi:hypothetical protein